MQTLKRSDLKVRVSRKQSLNVGQTTVRLGRSRAVEANDGDGSKVTPRRRGKQTFDAGPRKFTTPQRAAAYGVMLEPLHVDDFLSTGAQSSPPHAELNCFCTNS